MTQLSRIALTTALTLAAAGAQAAPTFRKAWRAGAVRAIRRGHPRGDRGAAAEGGVIAQESSFSAC